MGAIAPIFPEEQRTMIEYYHCVDDLTGEIYETIQVDLDIHKDITDIIPTICTWGVMFLKCNGLWERNWGHGS
jgi:hypothetical protein